MSGSELESKKLAEDENGYRNSDGKKSSPVQTETNETLSESGKYTPHRSNTSHSEEVGVTGATTENSAREPSTNHPADGNNWVKENNDSSDRLLDRINKQKDRLAQERALQEAQRNAGTTNISQPSDLMEQAWQNIDSNVKKLTRADNIPIPGSDNQQLPDTTFGEEVFGPPKVAWNSSPDHIGSGQLALRQQGLAQQLPYNPHQEPPQIPGPEHSQNPYISDNQHSQSLPDTLWDDDPVFTQSAQISEQSKTNSGSRLLGMGITFAVISAGLYYVTAKVQPFVSEVYRLQQTAQEKKVNDSKIATITGDLAQQTISSPIVEDNTAKDHSNSEKNSLQNHDSAIRGKLGSDSTSQPEQNLTAKEAGQPDQLNENAGKPVVNKQILAEGITGPAGRNLAVKLKIPTQGYDGNGTVRFLGIPEEVMLSSGTRNNRTWSVPVQDLEGLTLISDSEFQGPFDVSVELRDSRNFITSRNSLSVNIEPSQPENSRNNQAVVAELVSEGTSGKTQNIIRSTSIIGVEKKPIPKQDNVVPLRQNHQVPIRRQVDQLSPSLSTVLLARGKRFLQNGDIASARLAFEHLANNGHAAGAFALAQTYDPQWMANSKAVRGVQGDVTKAIQWYRLAADLGQNNAAGRIRELELEQR